MKKTTILTIFAMAFILFLMVIASPGLTDNLVSYWSLNETSGQYVEVVAGLNNGTIKNGVVRGWSGIQNSSATFNDTTGLISAGNDTTLNMGSTDFSISLWINITNVSSSSYAVRKGSTGAGAKRYGLFVKNESSVAFEIDDDSTGKALETAGDIVDRLWHHIAMVRDGNNMRMYVDGVEETNSPVDITGYGDLDSPNDNLTFFFFNGSLDEVGLWDDALTASEVSELYNSGVGLKYPLVSAEDLDVLLIDPINNTVISTTNKLLQANHTTANGYNLTNTTYHVWNGSGFLLNQTPITINLTFNHTNFNYTGIEFASYRWNTFTCALNGSGYTLCEWATNNNTFRRAVFAEDAEYHEDSVFDTDNSTFELNMSLDASADLFTASLLYNGTTYQADITDLGSGSFNIKTLIDIPVATVKTERQFNWTITLDIGTGFQIESTTLEYQNVTQTNMTQVGSTVAINYTIWDEETLTEINAPFDTTFSWFLGNGSVTKNTSFSISSAHEFDFWDAPTTERFYTSALIDLFNDSAANISYNRRVFDFRNEKYNSTATTHQKLYLLNASLGRNVLLQVKDEGLTPLANYIVKVYRFYPSDGLYRLVENKRTNSFGTASLFLIERNVRYTIEFYDENDVLVDTIFDDRVYCRTSSCELPIVIEDPTSPTTRLETIPGVFSDLVFDNSTNKFIFTWNDVNDVSSSFRFTVDRFQFNGTEEVCQEQSNASLGVFTCSVGGRKASYEARGFRTVDGEETLIEFETVKVQDTSDIFGLEGLMWGFILLFTLVLFGLFSPVVGIALYLIGLVFLGITGIVFISPAIMVAQLVIGILLIWALRT